MGRIIGPLHGFAADLEKFRRFPAVSSENRNCNPQVASLSDDQGRFGIITGSGDGFRAGRLDGRKLGLEILVTTAEFLLYQNLPSQSLEGALEIFGRPHAGR